MYITENKREQGSCSWAQAASRRKAPETQWQQLHCRHNLIVVTQVNIHPPTWTFLCTGTNISLRLLASEFISTTYHFSIHISFNMLQFKSSSHLFPSVLSHFHLISQIVGGKLYYVIIYLATSSLVSPIIGTKRGSGSSDIRHPKSLVLLQ